MTITKTTMAASGTATATATATEGATTLPAGATPRSSAGSRRSGTRSPATVRVALAGCGAVGGDLVRLLHHREAEIRARFGLRFEIVRVLVRGSARARPAELPRPLLTTDLESFLGVDAHVVVEVIGGLDPALRIAYATLGRGRRLVTANKTLVAAHGPKLVRLARRNRARIDFESAVAGGIPVVRAIRDQLAATDITSVRGILNGTTNYILTRLARGDRYVDALAAAQEAGYAEADPSRDVNGADAADKIRILAWLAFGADPALLPVRVRGITPDADRFAAAAASLGGVPRLVAECRRSPEGVTAVVEPVVVGSDSELGQVQGADNIVVIESRWNGLLRLAGPGAGGGPTASAVLGDLIRSARPLRPPSDGAPLIGVPERGLHRWLLTVPADGGPAAATRAIERAGIPAELMARDGATLGLRVEAAPWSRIDLALRSLRSAGLAAAAFRDGM
jgi:homoserine dehydrogenase